MGFRLEQYSIADYIRFKKDNRLVLNPDFQRREVWKQSMQVYLIDTILNEMSIPKIYLRTKIDPKTHDMIRDVVDGQQRLRAIIKFANNELVLSSKSEKYRGKRYADLDPEMQTRFLTYVISTEHLINADDDFVVKVFARLNQYGVKLNNAEIRNAQYSGEFKMAVVEVTQIWSKKYGEMGILSINERTRMLDDELTVELFQIVTKGIQAGTDSALKRMYKEKDKIFPDKVGVVEKTEKILDFLYNRLPYEVGSPIFNRPHFVMLFAAVAHTMHGIDTKNVILDKEKSVFLKETSLPANDNEFEVLIRRLQRMGDIILDPEPPGGEWDDFYYFSRGATINEKSRRRRFPYYLKAFCDYGEDIFT
jgi:Protein of unknown function DUF262